MILIIIFACFYNQPQPEARVEIVDSEIEIIFVQGI
jgi:hypothetical protein